MATNSNHANLVAALQAMKDREEESVDLHIDFLEQGIKAQMKNDKVKEDDFAVIIEYQAQRVKVHQLNRLRAELALVSYEERMITIHSVNRAVLSQRRIAISREINALEM